MYATIYTDVLIVLQYGSENVFIELRTFGCTVAMLPAMIDDGCYVRPICVHLNISRTMTASAGLISYLWSSLVR